jgi:hypothetical protein
MIEATLKHFNMSALEGVLSHDMYQNVIDGDQVIQTTLNKDRYEVDSFHF